MGRGFQAGTAQNVKEFILAGEYKLTGWLMTRAEFRTDRSDKPFFEKKNQPDGASS
jgi:hypothetical protein